MPRALKFGLFVLLGLLIYIATAIPLGMWVYSLKSKKGINLFETTGVHSYISCLRKEAHKARIEVKKRQATPADDPAP